MIARKFVYEIKNNKSLLMFLILKICDVNICICCYQRNCFFTQIFFIFQLVTEKTLRCDNKQDISMNYEFCSEKLSMLEILFYGRNKPTSVLTKITVQSRGKTLNIHTHDTITCSMSIIICNVHLQLKTSIFIEQDFQFSCTSILSGYSPAVTTE